MQLTKLIGALSLALGVAGVPIDRTLVDTMGKPIHDLPVNPKTGARPVPKEDQWGPVIGIIAQELPESFKHIGKSFIAASYVKWLESGGARIVPILYDYTVEEVDYIFERVNAIVYPGGLDLDESHPAYITANYIFNKARRENEDGNVYPLWGTCLGFQVFTHIVAGHDVFTDTDSLDLSLPLNFTVDPRDTQLWGDAPQEYIDWVQDESMCLHAHMHSLSVERYQSEPIINKFFRDTTHNRDRNGMLFVSSMEARDYPFFVHQWHAEKEEFEWGRNINHSWKATRVMTWVGDKFVSLARENNNRWKNEISLNNQLIYNFDAIFSVKMVPVFQEAVVQMYIFQDAEEERKKTFPGMNTEGDEAEDDDRSSSDGADGVVMRHGREAQEEKVIELETEQMRRDFEKMRTQF
eukprot:Clim_evm26s247 gene=Clim_evmTU26s247